MDPESYIQGLRYKIDESKKKDTQSYIRLCKISESKEKNTQGKTHICKHTYTYIFCHNQDKNIALG